MCFFQGFNVSVGISMSVSISIVQGARVGKSGVGSGGENGQRRYCTCVLG